MVRFQEILRRLAIIDEGFVEGQARLGLDPAGPAALDAKTAALVRVGVLAAIGAPAVGLEWGTTRALAAGATEEEITGVSRPRWTTRTSADGSPAYRASGYHWVPGRARSIARIR